MNTIASGLRHLYWEKYLSYFMAEPLKTTKYFFNRRWSVFIFLIHYPIAWKNELTFNLALRILILVVNISKCFTLSCRQDYWSSGRGRPAVDELKNVTLMNATEMDGYTMVDFKRPANTGDPKDVLIMVRTRNNTLPHCWFISFLF